MAHNVEPMDIDSDFDNKENSVHNSNVYPRTPCTEKGYEELDVSELNMKLRYSVTPVASPMSKSYTANCIDNQNFESGEDYLNGNLTRSFNSVLPKNDNVNKSVKALPLQPISAEQFVDKSRNASVLRSLDSTSSVNVGDVTITVSATNDNYDLPSSSSSTIQTPEAITPTMELPSADGGSPIMRGLKSVLNMFRPSQSPIPLAESEDSVIKPVFSPADVIADVDSSKQLSQAVLASTPIATQKIKESAKRSSPLKESIVFNDDLEKELMWKDETTIFFKEEKIPIYKLFYPTPTGSIKCNNDEKPPINESLNASVEYMDISCNDSFVNDKTITDIQSERQIVGESDGEFVDCETTFTNDKSEDIDIQENDKIVMLEHYLPQTNKTDSFRPVQLDDKTITVSNNVTSPLNTSEANVELLVAQSISDDQLTKLKDMDKGCAVSINNDVDPVPPPTGTCKMEEESRGAYSPQNLNEPKELNECIKQFLDSQHNNEIQINSECLQDETIKSEQELPDTSKDISPIGFEDRINITNFSDIVPVSKEEFSDQTPNNSLMEDQRINPEICNIFPANIPLPDEDNFEIEEESKGNDSTNICIVDSHIQNKTFDTELESTAHVDRVPSNPAAPASENNYKETCIDIDTKVISTIIADSESNSRDFSISTCESENTSSKEFNIAQTVDDFTQGIKADIDNIVRDAQLLIEGKQEELQVCGDLKLKEDEHLVNNTELKNVETRLCNQNEEVANAFKPEFTNTVELNSKKGNENTQNEINTTENRENELKTTTNNENELNSPETHYDLNSTENNQNKFSTTETIETELNPTETIRFELNSTETDKNELNPIEIDKNELNSAETNEINLNSTESNEIHVNSSETKNIELNSTVTNEIKLNAHYEENKITTEIHCSNEIIVEDFHQEDLQIIQIPREIVNENLQKSSNEDEPDVHESVEIVPKLADSIKHFGIEPLTTMAKTDVIPDAKEGNVPNHTSGESIEKTAETTDIGNEMKSKKTKEVLVENKNEEENNITICKTLTNEVIFENKDEVEINIDEEVILSESNSPFVSIDHENNQVQPQDINLDESMNPFATQTKITVSPPISPKISSKGYNFNFDEIDDPFATKTKIRLSPPPDSPEKNVIEGVKAISHPKDRNRRKSQPERKKSVAVKNTINKTFSGAVNVPARKTPKATGSSIIDVPLDLKNQDSLTLDSLHANNIISKIDDELQSQTSSCSKEKVEQLEDKENTQILQNEVEKNTEVVTEEIKATEKSITSSIEVRQASSSEQSAYYSAETSTESTKTKNVFNIPEIDDINFNPFITKLKVRESPPRINNSFSNQYNSNEESCPINKASESLEDKECGNISNITCSSKTTDEKDVTVREVEVHTEDEDTLEGPFLEIEDLNIVDKITDLDGEDVDMMQFSELPTQSNEEQLEGGEMFIDAEAFEFLLNQNKSNVVADSGKESLFLKFDPLFAKRVSTDGVLAALSNVQKRQSTPKKVSVAQQLDSTFEKPVPGPSNLNATPKINTNESVEESSEDLNVTVSKPMMVVTPAVNPVTTRNKSMTPTSSNRRSITFTSPAIAVIDRLLSMSGNNSLLGHDNSMTQVSREQNEADHALIQLRELLAEKEIQVYNLRSESKELKDRLSTLESQMRALESDGEERLKKINDLNEKLCEKTKINKSMAAVVEEYERTIASLIAESEQDKKRNNEERIKLVKERDEQTAHLASMEVSFSDLHSKYEKSKQIILTCKANEDTYKKSIKDFEENLSKMQKNYELLKQHATSKLNHANQELEKMNKSHEAEVLKLNAMIKRKELHITSLEETLAQKTKANEELTAICDELINKVG